MTGAYLLGVLSTMFLVAAAFFLRFWKETRDGLFLAFAASFAIEGLSRAVQVLFPAIGMPWIIAVRLLASLLILAAILRKNLGKGS